MGCTQSNSNSKQPVKVQEQYQKVQIKNMQAKMQAVQNVGNGIKKTEYVECFQGVNENMSVMQNRLQMQAIDERKKIKSTLRQISQKSMIKFIQNRPGQHNK